MSDPEAGKAGRRGRSGERAESDGESVESRAVAQYLGDMIGQLQAMASAAKLDLLVYLLAMAREEAEAHARSPDDAPGSGRDPR